MEIQGPCLGGTCQKLACSNVLNSLRLHAGNVLGSGTGDKNPDARGPEFLQAKCVCTRRFTLA